MVRNRLIVDTDGGVDDAQALVMLIGNGVVPFAVTTVFGNVGLDEATRNTLAVLATLGVDCPVYEGCHQPLIQPVIDAKNVHGEDGLGGAARPVEIAKASDGHAVDFLRRVLTEAAASGERIDIIMIGPLTNMAMALRLSPDIVHGIGRLVIMGGTLLGRGNVTPAAEFNIYADPEAASIVFSAEIQTVLVPWESCIAHFMTGQETDAAFARAGPSAAREFSSSLCSHLRANARDRGRGDILMFIDPLAAAIIVDPEIVTASIKGSIDTALSAGITRGMTIIDPSGRLGTPENTIVERVDGERLAALYAASVAYVPT